MKNSIMLAALIWSLLDAAIHPVAAQDDVQAPRNYEVQIQLYSWVEGQGITSYNSHGGSGMAAPGGTFKMAGHLFEVEVTPVLRENRLRASVKVAPHEENSPAAAMEREIDLSNLQAQSLELGREMDGRSYRLNLTPTVKVHQLPRQFDPAEFKLENMSFQNSTVIMDDLQYVGQLNMAQGSLAWLEIPGEAKIEFSLLDLKDSQPWGALRDGVIHIHNDIGKTIRIDNVANGRQKATLMGGPYRIWVRWTESTLTAEELRARLREMIANPPGGAPAAMQEMLQIWLDSDRIPLLNSGVRSVTPADMANVEDNPAR